jgi:hypothetical protein
MMEDIYLNNNIGSLNSSSGLEMSDLEGYDD